MSEPQFFTPSAKLSLREIADMVGATPPSTAHAERAICNVAALDQAGPDDLAFADHPKYAERLAQTQAGICLVAERFAALAPAMTAALVVAEPYRAFVEVARRLFPDALRPSSLFAAEGVAAGACVHPTARLEAEVRIDPTAVVGPRAEIGAGSVIAAGAVIGPEVRIGRDCAIGAGATIAHALIGDRVTIHPGCRIGQDGFGFVMGRGGHLKVPQVGRTIIQDDVEIGANCTIDRGASRDTIIGEGSKIDNLVQVGHNVIIGRHCVIVSQCGISGSVVLGDFVVLAGQVGIADHCTIGEGAQVGAQSGIMNDIPAGERWFGYPAMRGREYLRRLTRAARDAIGGQRLHRRAPGSTE